MKFYICNTCKNLIEKIFDSGVTPVCCGRQMTELLPASTDGAHEKHVPVFSVHPMNTSPAINEIHVQVGELQHPSESYHYIMWITVETDKGSHRQLLAPGSAPEATFYIPASESIVAVYAYCNLHGLWVNTKAS